MLYNYGGGFIRRGLWGEILFAVNSFSGVSPVIFCHTVSIVCLAILAWWLIRKLRQKGYGWYIVTAGFMLGSVGTLGLDSMRRDYMELALMLLMVVSFRRLSFKPWLVVGNLIGIFAILLHEATFFFMVPAAIALSYAINRKFWLSIAQWLPCLAIFIICCLCKGSSEMQTAVIESVHAHFPGLISGDEIPWSLHFIGADTHEVLKMHVALNIISLSDYMIPAAVVTLLLVVYLYYMSMAMPTAFASRAVNFGEFRSLSAIMIFQFIALLPMFTLLSCDIGRVAVYWTVSSYIIWLAIDNDTTERMFPESYSRVCGRLSDNMLRYLKPTKWFTTLLFLMVGFPLVGRTERFIFHASAGFRIFYNYYIAKILPFFI